MTRIRPTRSAIRPAYHAPTAQPMSAIDTMNPVWPGVVENCAEMPGTAPLMTGEPKPNRKPPSAATTDTAMTRRPVHGAAGLPGAAELREPGDLASIMDR